MSAPDLLVMGGLLASMFCPLAVALSQVLR